jgi:hypothetical protein
MLSKELIISLDVMFICKSLAVGSADVKLQVQRQSYVATDGQSASLSWSQAPIWGPRPDFCYFQTVAGLLMWGALCDERTGLSFILLQVILRSESRGTLDYILLSQNRDSPNLEGQVPVFISPRNRVTQLYPRHWVPSYNFMYRPCFYT